MASVTTRSGALACRLKLAVNRRQRSRQLCNSKGRRTRAPPHGRKDRAHISHRAGGGIRTRQLGVLRAASSEPRLCCSKAATPELCCAWPLPGVVQRQVSLGSACPEQHRRGHIGSGQVPRATGCLLVIDGCFCSQHCIALHQLPPQRMTPFHGKSPPMT